MPSDDWKNNWSAGSELAPPFSSLLQMFSPSLNVQLKVLSAWRKKKCVWFQKEQKSPEASSYTHSQIPHIHAVQLQTHIPAAAISTSESWRQKDFFFLLALKCKVLNDNLHILQFCPFCIILSIMLFINTQKKTIS